MVKRLVLLPGMDGTGLLFADLVAALPDAFQTTVVRFPADVCLSYAELLPALTAAVPVAEPYFLLAESFSTPLAVQFAAANPSNIRGLILCAGFIASPARGWQRCAATLLARILFRLPLADVAIEHFLLGRDAPSSLLAATRATIATVSPEVLSDRLRQILACDARAELGRIAVPMLYLHAQQDRLVPALRLEEIRRIKPQTEVSEIAGPHLLLQREPRKCAEAIARFVGQQPPSPASTARVPGP